jgi:hypothetical protein
MTTLRGELRCFACSRYLGDFESHPDRHGKDDLHLVPPPEGKRAFEAVATEQGLRCSVCGGRVVYAELERFAA